MFLNQKIGPLTVNVGCSYQMKTQPEYMTTKGDLFIPKNLGQHLKHATQ